MLNVIVFFYYLSQRNIYLFLTKSKENLLLLMNTIFWSKNNIILNNFCSKILLF